MMLDKRYRSAIKKLIEHYRKFPEGQVEGIGLEEECPLCQVDDEIKVPNLGTCDSCPWFIYDVKCWVAAYEEDPAGVRIKRLKGWLERMEEESINV